MAERIITPDWLILRQAIYGSHVTPLWPHKYAHRKKSAMIVLSGHFKALIFYKIFDVLNSVVITEDHCTLAHSRSIVCYLLSIRSFCCVTPNVFIEDYIYTKNYVNRTTLREVLRFLSQNLSKISLWGQ